MLFGRCLYVVVCRYIIERQLQELRRTMGIAMGDAGGRHPDGARLLATAGGKWELEVVRIKRVVKHWQNTMDEPRRSIGSPCLA